MGVPYDIYTKAQVLENIKKYLKDDEGFYHIVSLNPEIVMLARKNHQYKQVIRTANAIILDGTFAVVAIRLLARIRAPRLQGVDLMTDMLKIADKHSLTVMLIGGGPKIADQVVQCQKSKYPRTKFIATEGIKNIRKSGREEESSIFSIVAKRKPRFVFVAFGSPWQELWIDRHKSQFKGSVCMGVGGAFDFLSGRVPRAPLFLRQLGLEWLYRLIRQPWRISRHIKLIQYISLVIRKKFRQDKRK